jgi:hypothetical protein
MKHDPKATANGAAVTVAIIYIICRVGVFLFPDLSMSIAQSWFHGIQLTQISELRLTSGSFVLGLVTSMIFAWLVGYLFANLYNYFAKK